MVLRLGAALDVPLRERNQLLQAAGLAPAYPEADVQAPALEPFRRAMESNATSPTRRSVPPS